MGPRCREGAPPATIDSVAAPASRRGRCRALSPARETYGTAWGHDAPAWVELVGVHGGIAMPALRERSNGCHFRTIEGAFVHERHRPERLRALRVPIPGQRLPVPCRRCAAQRLHESHGCLHLGDDQRHPMRRFIGLARIRSVPRAVGSGEHFGNGPQYHVSRAGRL